MSDSSTGLTGNIFAVLEKFRSLTILILDMVSNIEVEIYPSLLLIQPLLLLTELQDFTFSKSDIRALPVSNLSAAPVMYGCIPAREGF